MLKRFRRSGGSSGGDDPEKHKGKTKIKSLASKRKATVELSENKYGIVFRNDEQRARYNVLISRKLACSRYADLSTMQTLGIHNDIGWMFNNIGWSDLMSDQSPTYPRITLEFLSSMEVTHKNNNEGIVTFRLLNNEYSWSFAEFNTCFMLPNGANKEFDGRFNSGKFWKKLTGSDIPYDPSKSKASMFQNPVFRYVHRVMTKTIFGRAESDGVVRKLELYCLWAMIYSVEFDSGYHFLQNLYRIAKSSTGIIVVGGLLSTIASSLGCDVSKLEILEGNSRIDLASCLQMKMIVKIEGGYGFNISDGYPFPLPHQDTTIRKAENWILSAPVPSHTTPSYHEPQSEEAQGTSHQHDFSLPEQVFPEAEPARYSYAYGEGSSTYDFSEFRTSLGLLHEEHTEHTRQLGEYGAMTQRQFKEVQDHFSRANEFYNNVNRFVERQRVEWGREEEFRRSMDLTRRQIDALYQYHEHLGTVERLPNFPLPPRQPPP